uniref:Ig-like domain-containing protein n=1 Tax=Neogobius melanostomus TaxID=47308 RepID=A0A8C6UUD8_9GOBI
MLCYRFIWEIVISRAIFSKCIFLIWHSWLSGLSLDRKVGGSNPIPVVVSYNCATIVRVLSHAQSCKTTRDWNDVTVVREGTVATLVCIDETATGAVSVNWMAKPLGTARFKLVLSANERKELSTGASKHSVQLTDHNFQDTGVFSLRFRPERDDGGLYMCLVKRRLKVLKERFILLAVLTVRVVPLFPVPQNSTLRLIASVHPELGISQIIWVTPGAISLKTEKITNFGTISKLPLVQSSDDGAYVCMVYPKGNSSSAFFAFNVDVKVDADKVASFTNISHGDQISTAALADTVFPLTCPNVLGTMCNCTGDLRMLTGRGVYEGGAGSFSFLLTPGTKDGGLYKCEVYKNDNTFSLLTLLTVVKVKTRQRSSKLELDCRYSELSQVQSAVWTFQNQSHRLPKESSLGSITTSVPLPVRADRAGNYTCVLQLKNGQTVRATHTVTLPPRGGSNESAGVSDPSLLPSLSALLLVVPLVALVVGAFLWRRRHGSDRGIEQSLSVRSGETENIYENPEDMRQAPPQGSVYMVSFCVVPYYTLHGEFLCFNFIYRLL